MKNNQNITDYGQNTRIFLAKAAYFHAKCGLWLSRPSPKGQFWA